MAHKMNSKRTLLTLLSLEMSRLEVFYFRAILQIKYMLIPNFERPGDLRVNKTLSVWLNILTRWSALSQYSLSTCTCPYMLVRYALCTWGVSCLLPIPDEQGATAGHADTTSRTPVPHALSPAGHERAAHK